MLTFTPDNPSPPHSHPHIPPSSLLLKNKHQQSDQDARARMEYVINSMNALSAACWAPILTAYAGKYGYTHLTDIEFLEPDLLPAIIRLCPNLETLINIGPVHASSDLSALPRIAHSLRHLTLRFEPRFVSGNQEHKRIAAAIGALTNLESLAVCFRNPQQVLVHKGYITIVHHACVHVHRCSFMYVLHLGLRTMARPPCHQACSQFTKQCEGIGDMAKKASCFAPQMFHG